MGYKDGGCGSVFKKSPSSWRYRCTELVSLTRAGVDAHIAWEPGLKGV